MQLHLRAAWQLRIPSCASVQRSLSTLLILSPPPCDELGRCPSIMMGRFPVERNRPSHPKRRRSASSDLRLHAFGYYRNIVTSAEVAMGHPTKMAEFTASDYLAWENARLDKNEFLRDEVYPKVGATRKHVTAAGNLSSLLSTHLQNSRCTVYISDMKLRIETADAIFYPDVLVTCDPKDHQPDSYMLSPVLIVEVLSPSTEAYDRGEEFAAYRKVPTLREYLLIDPESRRVEIYRAGSEGQWVLNEIDPNGTLNLQSVNLEVPVQQFFENVRHGAAR